MRTDDPRATSPSTSLKQSSKSRLPPKATPGQPASAPPPRMPISTTGVRPPSVASPPLPSPVSAYPRAHAPAATSHHPAPLPTGPRHPSNITLTDAETTALVARFSSLVEPLQQRVRQLEDERDAMSRRIESLEAHTKDVVEGVFEARIKVLEARFVERSPAAAPPVDAVTRAELDQLASKTRAELAKCATSDALSKCATTEALGKMGDKFKSSLDRYYVEKVQVEEIVKEVVRKEGFKALKAKLDACQETVDDLGARVEQVEGSVGNSREAIGKVRAQVGQRLDLLESAADDRPVSSEQARQTADQLATLSRQQSTTSSALAALEATVDTLPTYDLIADVLKDTVVAEVAEALSLLPQPTMDLSKVESLITSHFDLLSIPSRLDVLENDAQVAETHLRALPATIKTVISEHQSDWIFPLVKDEVAVALGGDKLVLALGPAFANKAQTNAKLENAMGELATMRGSISRLETITPRVPMLEQDVRHSAQEIRGLKQSVDAISVDRVKMGRVIAGVADALRTATPLLEAAVAPAAPVPFAPRDLVV